MFKNNLNIENLKIDLLNIYNSGDWCKIVPEFQTFPTLFEIKKNHWQELKNNFIDEVTKHTKIVPIHVKAWCYANFPGYAQKEWPIWHTHIEQDKKQLKICGVMYLTNSEEGTVFLKENNYVYLSSDIGIWNFFQPDQLHSPPKWDPNNKTNRYCIAAEAIYV